MAPIFLEIDELSTRFTTYVIQHLSRSANGPAHLCAKRACTMPVIESWLTETPSFMISSLLADCSTNAFFWIKLSQRKECTLLMRPKYFCEMLPRFVCNLVAPQAESSECNFVIRLLLRLLIHSSPYHPKCLLCLSSYHIPMRISERLNQQILRLMKSPHAPRSRWAHHTTERIALENLKYHWITI